MAFRVGQKLVCQNAQPETYPGNTLVRGGIYTVDFIHEDGGILLIEADVPYPFVTFDETRFRPLVETNIDIFQAMLVNPHREVEVAE